MLAKVRNKDNKDIVQTGIPVQQWTMETNGGDKLRLYLILPVESKDGRYCEVRVVIEEAEEWLVISKDDDYTNRPLLEKELSAPEEQTEEDLYYVWDDGAAEHLKRARRLYAYYKNDIEALSS